MESGVTLALIGQTQTKNDVFWCTEQSISVAFAVNEDYIWNNETSSQFVISLKMSKKKLEVITQVCTNGHWLNKIKSKISPFKIYNQRALI